MTECCLVHENADSRRKTLCSVKQESRQLDLKEDTSLVMFVLGVGLGVGGLLFAFFFLHLGGFIVGYSCSKWQLSSWFRLNVRMAWWSGVSFEIHLHDIVLGKRVMGRITEKLTFHLPLNCVEVTVAHLVLKWMITGPRCGLIPHINLDGVVLRTQVTSLTDWNSPSSLPLRPRFSLCTYVACAKKHQVANHLTSMVEDFLCESNVVKADKGSKLFALFIDALISNIHISLSNFELR